MTEREQFEAAMSAYCDPARVEETFYREGDYYNAYATMFAWEAWQAARATPADHSVPVATAHRILDELIDIYDDGNNNAPEDRCYVEGAWREVLDEARAYLAAPQPPQNAADHIEAQSVADMRMLIQRLAHSLRKDSPE